MSQTPSYAAAAEPAQGTMTFDKFFAQATSGAKSTGLAPYDYQCRLACGTKAAGETDEGWLLRGTTCESKLIEIPTGLGKTAAVVLAWLWNRVLQPDTAARRLWPRRLVYCLPMRTLVEQTERCIRAWLAAFPEAKMSREDVHVLMGGAESGSWDIHPEREAIFIGTQDMLLSRALNRGYGMSRYRWPIHFGFLNHDALWVMDETQLMGVAVETSAQLDAFRSLTGKCPTWWMSATLDPVRLATVDHPEPAGGWPRTTLQAADRQAPSVRLREGATKRLRRADTALASDKKDDVVAYVLALAEEVLAAHRPGTLTLVVVNRVARAQAIFRALEKRAPQQVKALLHSRFRSPDRSLQQEILLAAGDRIVVATQAVEAGVDVSARTLFTELAPWSSLVQRFGRCHRAGEFPEGADVLWIDLPTEDDKAVLPYLPQELSVARAVLHRLAEVGPFALSAEKIEPVRPIRPVLRRKDLLDLFDTTADLAGNDLDISRYVRDGDSSDVQVFWREIEKEAGPGEDTGTPARPELCAVSLFEFGKFLEAERKRAKEKHRDPRIWTWNPLEDEWQPAHRPVPGRIYLLATDVGGYSPEYGWTGDPQHQPAALPSGGEAEPSYDSDFRTKIGRWVTLGQHTSDVRSAVDDLAIALEIDAPTRVLLRTAALWHDVGKAHGVFQRMLQKSPTCPDATTYWAKSDRFAGRPERRHFRHELASALAWLQSPDCAALDDLAQSLVAYLIASHHGKVRVSLRALPDEVGPKGEDALFARGIHHGDALPAPGAPPIVIEGREFPAIAALDLRCMLLGETEGRPSWLSRVLSLRNHKEIGPFRLAWLEAVFRAADARASAAEQRQGSPDGSARASACAVVREEGSEDSKSTPPLTDAQRALVADLVADGLEIQHKFRPEPLYRATGRGHYESDTVSEIRRARGGASRPKGKP